jgi:hypothetical protein
VEKSSILSPRVVAHRGEDVSSKPDENGAVGHGAARPIEDGRPVLTDEGKGGGGETDAEEASTEMWSPVARNLFDQEIAAKWTRQVGREGEGPREKKPRTDPAPPAPGEAATGPAEESSAPTGEASAAAGEASAAPADRSGPEGGQAQAVAEGGGDGGAAVGGGAATDEGREPVAPDVAGGGQVVTSDAGAVVATGEVHAEPGPDAGADAARAEAATQTTGEFERAAREAARILGGSSIEVSGPEAEVAYVEPSGTGPRRGLSRQSDPDSTAEVEKPRGISKLRRECRMCGRKVKDPRPYHFRGATGGVRGFVCIHCKNVFCAAHVVRVSGFFESLLGEGRFSCTLCLGDRPSEGEPPPG